MFLFCWEGGGGGGEGMQKSGGIALTADLGEETVYTLVFLNDCIYIGIPQWLSGLSLWRSPWDNRTSWLGIKS